MLTEEELIERRQFLGASDASAALGLNKWKSPLKLWREKIGEEEITLEDRLQLQIGRVCEPVAIEFVELTKKVKVADRQRKLVDTNLPWRRVTLDGIASNGWLVEAKTTGFAGENWGEEGTDQIPIQYNYQVQHALAITGLEHAYVPLIISNTRFRMYEVHRDEELIEIVTDRERLFWQYVELREPPTAITHDDIKLLYPRDKGTSVIATPEIEAIAYRCKEAKDTRKHWEKEEEELCLELKKFMGDACQLITKHGELLFTYNTADRSNFEIKRFREDQPDVARLYTKVSPARTLLCKL